MWCVIIRDYELQQVSFKRPLRVLRLFLNTIHPFEPDFSFVSYLSFNNVYNVNSPELREDAISIFLEVSVQL